MKIGQKLILWFLLVIVLLALTSKIAFRSQEVAIEKDAYSQLERERSLYLAIKKRSFERMGAVIHMLSQDESWKGAFKQQDRGRLYDEMKPISESLIRGLGLEILKFILPDGQNFLRMQDRALYGDLAEYAVFREAQRAKTLVFGMGMGKSGFAARAIVPCSLNGELIGFIEAGESVDSLLAVLKGDSKDQLVLLVSKEMLNKEQWEYWALSNSAQNEWGRYEAHVVLGNTMKSGGESLLKYVSAEHIKAASEEIIDFGQISADGNKYYFGGFPVFEEDGRPLGVMCIFVEETESIASADSVKKKLIIFIMAILGFLMWLGFRVSRSIVLPLQELKKSADMIGAGNFNTAIKVRSKDEVGDLASAFQKMSLSLKESTTSRAYVESIIANMKDALIVTDGAFAIEQANVSAQYLLGYEEREVVGRYITNFLFRQDGTALADNDLKSMVSDGAFTNIEMKLKAKSENSIPVIISGSALHNTKTNLTAYIFVATDIDELKRAADEVKSAYTKLKEAQERLVQSEKMEAIGRMAVGIAHEVKNPLGILLQAVNYLEVSPAEGSAEKKLYAMMKANIMRADRIVRALLDFSRSTEMSMQPEEIDGMIDRALTLVEHRLKLVKVEIVKEYAPGLPRVLVDIGKMEQVFINLFLNAIFAMPSGGKIFIKISRASEGFVLVKVKDTGNGIRAEDLPRVFDPFFTTKNKTEGTGLGLAVTKSIVEMHNGDIKIESVYGKGTTVTVRITSERK